MVILIILSYLPLYGEIGVKEEIQAYNFTEKVLNT